MSDTEEKPTDRRPTPTVSAHTIRLGGETVPYRAECGWTTLYRHEKPAAEIFSVFYETESTEPEARPLTFVFNGGPGAASAYLHLGALGPRRVVFNEDGSAPPPPVKLADNQETWLEFTDLVFVDPIGTGFSRVLPDEKSEKSQDDKSEDPTVEKSKEYWKITRDLESLCDFIASFLSRNHRWESPVYIAGESYGGFRGAKLTRLLQEEYGVGLSGAILISPALEFSLLDDSDYDLLPWIDRIPSMAAAALHHGKARLKEEPESIEGYLRDAETFATGELASLLLRGASLRESSRRRTLRKLSSLIGLPTDLLDRSAGRISATAFARGLLRDQGLACSLYDATITTADPFPAREAYEGPDAILRAGERVFASGINAHLRRKLGVDTERRYHLLSMEVNRNWQVDIERHALESQIGATDDLRYGMSLNRHMKVRITHGIYDLVTPYFASNRIADLLYLSPELRENLSLVHYPGGHMFYAWSESREKFARDMKEFYTGVSSLR